MGISIEYILIFKILGQLPFGIIAPASLANVGSCDDGGVKSNGAINNHIALILPIVVSLLAG